MRERRGHTEREAIARRVADAVEDALSCTDPDPDAEPESAHSVDRLELPALCLSAADRE
jgi:hypothetical protein